MSSAEVSEITDLISSKETLESATKRLGNNEVLRLLNLMQPTTCKRRAKLLKELEKKCQNIEPRANMNMLQDYWNASKVQLDIYDEILECLNKLMKKTKKKKIQHHSKFNEEKKKKIKILMEALRFLHKENTRIAVNTSLYRQQNDEFPALHEEHYLHHETKVVIFFDTLSKAYKLAQDHQLLHSFFLEGLYKSTGCLEARMEHLLRWYTKWSEATDKTQFVDNIDDYLLVLEKIEKINGDEASCRNLFIDAIHETLRLHNGKTDLSTKEKITKEYLIDRVNKYLFLDKDLTVDDLKPAR